MANIEKNRALLKEQIARIKNELSEHHGDDWGDELLSMKLTDFLDKVREIDINKYEAIEAIIDSISEKF
jgi:hypothetical protein